MSRYKTRKIAASISSLSLSLQYVVGRAVPTYFTNVVGAAAKSNDNNNV
jgi:hypothetical protein